MPTGQYEPDRGWFHGSNVWRTLIVFCLIGLGIALALGVALYQSNRDSIEQAQEALASAKQGIANNRDLGCRVGGFLVGVPIVKQPGTKQADFEKQVEKALAFLGALRKLDCKGLGGVTTEKIATQEKALQSIVGGGGRSTGNPHSPGSLPGGGPAPPPTTTTPTTTTPSPPTTTTGPITHLVCHLNLLGVRVCVRVPASP